MTRHARQETTRDQDIYWIDRPEQLSTLISSRRQAIGDHLAAAGPMSARELAASMGMKPSAMYHHLKLLLDADLIVEHGSRITNRRREIVYAAPASRLRYGPSLKAASARDTYRQLNEAQSRQINRDFARGLELDSAVAEGPGKNLRTFRIVGAPDPETLAAINQRLEEIAEMLWASAGQDHPLVALSCIMAPIPAATETNSKHQPRSAD